MDFEVQIPVGVQSVRVVLETEKGYREQVQIEGRPGRHHHKLRVPQGDYDFVVRVQHLDGSVSQSRKKIRLHSDVRMRLTVH